MSREGKNRNIRRVSLAMLLGMLLGAPLVFGNPAQPAMYEKMTQKTQNAVREKLVPLLVKYCGNFCELIAVTVELDEDISVAEDMGFESVVPERVPDLIVRKIDANIQIDERMGTENRVRLAKIMEIHLGGLAMAAQVNWFPVKMPKLPGSRDDRELLDNIDEEEGATEAVAGGVDLNRVKANPGAEQRLRAGIEEKVASALNGVISQYCPHQCLVERIDVAGEQTSKGSAGSLLPSQYASDPRTGTIFRIHSVQADVTVDGKLEEKTREQILKMMQARTRFVTPVYINVGVIEFPESYSEKKQRENISETDPYGLEKLRQMLIMFRDLAGTKEIVTNTTNTSTNESTKTERTDASIHATHDSTVNTNTTANNTHRIVSDSKTSTSSNTSATTASQTNTEASKSEASAGFLGNMSPQEVAAYGAGFLILLALVIIAVARFSRTTKDAGDMMQYPEMGMGNHMTPRRGEESGGEEKSQQGPASAGQELATGIKVNELKQELVDLFMQNPKVARETFGRILKEDGVELAAKYLHIFGYLIIYELLNDPGLQRELYELSEYYHNSNFQFSTPEELDLLIRLKTRVTASEIRVLTQKSSEKFEFLQKLDPGQIYALISDENRQVQCIVLTQLDRKRRRMVFDLYQGDSKVQLMEQLSLAEAIPKEYLYNVAKILARKVSARSEFDTENLRSSDVLMDFLEKADIEEQRQLMATLQKNNPDTARSLKLKLITVEIMPFLKDGHLLELVLGMDRMDLLAFLAGVKQHIRDLLLKKAPEELADSWIEELGAITSIDEQVYKVAEMKVLGRIRNLANSGAISLLDINERIFAAPDAEFKPRDEAVMPLKRAALVA